MILSPGDYSNLTSRYIILARHGRTEFNRLGLLQGHLDVELDPKGMQQSHELAAELSKIYVGLILSSNLQRCIQTSISIALRQPGTPILLSAQLRERCFGWREGCPLGAKEPAVRSECDGNEGEELESFRGRVQRFIMLFESVNFKSPVLIVTHEGVIRNILEMLSSGSFVNEPKLTVRNCGVVCLEVNEAMRMRRFVTLTELALLFARNSVA